jgi:hypothetical protein
VLDSTRSARASEEVWLAGVLEGTVLAPSSGVRWTEVELDPIELV